MSRIILALLTLSLIGLSASAAPVPPPAARSDVWPGGLAPALSTDQQPRFVQSQPRRAQTQRRVQARRDAASIRAAQSVVPPLPPAAPPLLRNAELATGAVPAATATGPEPLPAPWWSVQVVPAPSPAVPQAQALPRSRNEPSTDPASYSTRAVGYLNGAVDYLRGGLSSISGYLPDWPFGWSGAEDSVSGQTRERLLVEAMSAAGYELATVARDGTLVTTVTYTFRQQRRPSPAERLLAGKLAADLSAASGGLGGYLEQVMIKSALEGTETTAFDVQIFELQTRPYPWLRSVAGPRSANR